MSNIFIENLRGLGDNIYSRPFIRALAHDNDVWLSTPWPELFDDLPVRFVRRDTTLRTQQDNIIRQSPDIWTEPPRAAHHIVPFYRMEHGESLVAGLERCFGAAPAGGWDLPAWAHDYTPLFPQTRRPLAVIRPVTTRKEWQNDARSPKWTYVWAAARHLVATHTVISVAHLKEGEEELVGDKPWSHRNLHSGQAGIKDLMRYVARSSIVVSGVGWAIPAAIAARVPVFTVWGGCGAHNGPAAITDPRMDLSKFGGAQPDQFCMCSQMQHTCNKHISNFEDQFKCFLQTTR